MSEEDGEEILTLKGDEAYNLFAQGKDTWNEWVKNNPIADINFSEIDFGERGKELGRKGINFTEFTFPVGKVLFSKAKFGDGFVDFSLAKFGDGDVDFFEATFGDGKVTFFWANFGEGQVDFSRVIFGEGKVDFSGVTFGEGRVDFSGVTFGEGNVSFFRAAFGEGDVNFFKATFGEGDVDFAKVTFSDGEVDFYNVTFGKGKVNFSNVTFGKGNLFFHFSVTEPTTIDFERTQFNGSASFNLLEDSKECDSINFKSSSFESVLSLQGEFQSVVDLTDTKLTNHLSLHNLNVCLKRERGTWHNIWTKIAKDPEDAVRFRRLKELAETAKDKPKALEFYANELRAMRWHHKGFFQSSLDIIYSGLCDYGQSIIRPALFLCLFSLIFTLIYTQFQLDPTKLRLAAELVAANTVPFLSISKSIFTSNIEPLFGDNQPWWYYLVGIAHGLTSFIFLFLIGLGLRNRFRV